LFEIEQGFIDQGYDFLIGIDEAGRGPLAGPVVAVAVGIKAKSFSCLVNNFKSRIDDSKKLTANSRRKAYGEIVEKLKVGTALCEPGIIDEVNILEATKLTMARSVSCLKLALQGTKKNKTCVLIDGKIDIDIPFSFFNIIGGDSKCFLISCASIVAKVIRDEIMRTYDSIYPAYGFSKHKGYGTKQHVLAIEKYGISPIHRKSFSPCKLKK